MKRLLTSTIIATLCFAARPGPSAGQSFTRITTGPIANDVGSSLRAGWADINNDGALDLFVTNGSIAENPELNFLYLNSGAPSYSLTRVRSNPIAEDLQASSSGTWADYDNDGDLDLVLVNFGGFNTALYRNDGVDANTGEVVFTSITSGPIIGEGGSSRNCAWADIDRDGHLDLFVSNTSGKNNFLYKNNGDGTFTKILDGPVVNDGGGSNTATFGDYDNDGDPDLFVGNTAETDGTDGAATNFLYENKGDGTFRRVEEGIVATDGGPSIDAAWGDFDRDGHLDLVVANINQRNFLYRNLGNGEFEKLFGSPVTNDDGPSSGCSWADFDNDGDLDLLITSTGLGGAISLLFRQERPGVFIRVTDAVIVLGDLSGGSWADYNNDGALDIFLTFRLAGPNSLFQNNGNANSWINITCIGTVSNRSAIGARVSARAVINGEPVWQTHEISSQPGGGQNSLNVEFGFGDATTIDSIRVRWPSGAVQNLTDIDINQFIEIHEPQFVRVTDGDIATDADRSSGAAWGDYDNDGDPDLYVANGAAQDNALYENTGRGTLQRITKGPLVSDGGSSQSATWADYDNDGQLDLFVSNSPGDNFLYRNVGGAFERVADQPVGTDGGNSKGAAWGDLDNDGDLDLFVANDRQTNFLYLNNGAGTFQKVEQGLVVTDRGDSFSGSWVDYDNDGDLDLFVTNVNDNFLYKNDGTGSFERVIESAIVRSTTTTLGSSWADYDNDNDLDVFLAGFGGAVLFRNDGRGADGEIVFTPGETVSSVNATGGGWADFDNDGDPDFFLATSGQNFMYRNDGIDTFIRLTESAPAVDAGNSNGAAWADINGDGLPDLFVANNNAPNALYRTGGTGNSWVQVKLQGRASNTSAIGARVQVSAVINGFTETQMQEISAQTGYFGQNTLVAGFGLGDAAAIDSIRVEWPSGAVNRYPEPLAPNALLKFEENNRPAVADSIPVITLDRKTSEFTRDLAGDSAVYIDADGDALQFQAIAADSTIAAANIEGSVLTISLRDEAAPGNASVTIIADDKRVDDGRGDTELLEIDINRPPLQLRTIDNIAFAPGDARPVVVTLGSVFRDQDVGDVVAYSIENSEPMFAVTEFDATTLTISRGDSAGQSEITVTAADNRGGAAVANFTVRTVESNNPPEFRGGLSDTPMILGGEPLGINLRPLFSDPDGDELTFSATSPSLSVVSVSIVDGATLVVQPLQLGTAQITVRANDGLGGEVPATFAVEVLASLRPDVMHTGPAQPQPRGQAIPIEASITDDERALEAVNLHYRPAGDSAFTVVAMDIEPFGIAGFRASSEIPGAVITARGLEYFISAIDNKGVESVRETISVRVIVDGEGLLNPTPQPAGNDINGFRIVSMPLDLEDKSPEAVFADDLGPYDPAKWRLFQWAARSDGGVLKPEFSGSGEAFNVDRGTAFWLIVKDPGKQIDSGPGVSLDTNTPFGKPVSKGWNLVGNPFFYPTQMADTLQDGSPVELYSWGASGWSDALDPRTTMLEPFSGYAVLAGAAGTLDIKARPFDAQQTPPSSEVPDDDPGLAIRISARSGSVVDRNNRIRLLETADPELDPADRAEPPPVDPSLAVYFPHPEWQAHVDRFSVDARPLPLEGDAWPIEIETATRDAVTLSFDGIDAVPDEFEIWLLDERLNIATNLREQTVYTFAGRQDGVPVRLSLVIGTPAHIQSSLAHVLQMPAAFELAQNFPNPSNPATTIRYTLPEQRWVSLKIFDVTGAEIATLVDAVRTAGTHVAVWDGTNSAGLRVASGLYFYRIRAGSFVATRKLVIVK